MTGRIMDLINYDKLYSGLISEPLLKTIVPVRSGIKGMREAA